MSVHVDVYSSAGPTVPDAVWDDEPLRYYDVQAIDYDRTRGPNGAPQPYCNGYTWRTPPHGDGECDRWKPTGRVWGEAS